MASARLKRSEAEMDDLVVDMSPMIDMVFLLLIFFMVNAVLIDYRKDKRVEIPTATVAKAPDDVSGRVVINVFDDETAAEAGYRYANENGEELDETGITQLVQRVKEMNDPEGITTHLHLRADEGVDVIWTKRAVKASAEAGVTSVIFSTYNDPNAS